MNKSHVSGIGIGVLISCVLVGVGFSLGAGARSQPEFTDEEIASAVREVKGGLQEALGNATEEVSEMVFRDRILACSIPSGGSVFVLSPDGQAHIITDTGNVLAVTISMDDGSYLYPNFANWYLGYRILGDGSRETIVERMVNQIPSP